MALLTIDTHRKIKQLTGIELRVLVNGVDVTNRCMCADADAGWALCLYHDENDRAVLGRYISEAATAIQQDGTIRVVRADEPVTEILEGAVRFVRRAERGDGV
jgi:hypothetical protein